MDRVELLDALKRLKIETGSIACLGCGYEHKCSTKGCAIIREAIEALELRNAEDKLPPDGEAVLAVCYDELEVTHWMPLPDEPKEEDA